MTRLTLEVLNNEIKNIKANMLASDKRNQEEHHDIKQMLEKALKTKAEKTDVERVNKDIDSLKSIIKWVAIVVVGTVIASVLKLVLR